MTCVIARADVTSHAARRAAASQPEEQALHLHIVRAGRPYRPSSACTVPVASAAAPGPAPTAAAAAGHGRRHSEDLGSIFESCLALDDFLAELAPGCVQHDTSLLPLRAGGAPLPPADGGDEPAAAQGGGDLLQAACGFLQRVSHGLLPLPAAAPRGDGGLAPVAALQGCARLASTPHLVLASAFLAASERSDGIRIRSSGEAAVQPADSGNGSNGSSNSSSDGGSGDGGDWLAVVSPALRCRLGDMLRFSPAALQVRACRTHSRAREPWLAGCFAAA